MSIRRRIDPAEGRQALEIWQEWRKHQSGDVDKATLATAVRYTVEEFAERNPGGAVEIRIPPFAAAQAIEGPKHSRGTPPNVVEVQPETWLLLVTGETDFAHEVEAGRVDASGTRSDLSEHLPLKDVL